MGHVRRIKMRAESLGAADAEWDRRDPRDVEKIARLQQRIRDLELQQEWLDDEETDTNSFIRDGGVRQGNFFDHEELDRDQSLTYRIADRGSIEVGLDQHDLKIKRIQRRVWNLELQHKTRRLKQGIQVLEALPTWKETEPEETVGDESTGDEEHPILEGFIYPSPPCFDIYQDEVLDTEEYLKVTKAVNGTDLERNELFCDSWSVTTPLKEVSSAMVGSQSIRQKVIVNKNQVDVPFDPGWFWSGSKTRGRVFFEDGENDAVAGAKDPGLGQTYGMGYRVWKLGRAWKLGYLEAGVIGFGIWGTFGESRWGLKAWGLLIIHIQLKTFLIPFPPPTELLLIVFTGGANKGSL
ncbi:hypothetical protein E3N88_31589 [Mikania micrantha]|uniref:Uncharacterized protein n=1 Tax=Mikania micrantha TaxID=192012 RepID=A0A5N6MPV8_9ASTR|nr:hypothetical protein E3N88_31589 [Mikania micrantha]